MGEKSEVAEVRSGVTAKSIVIGLVFVVLISVVNWHMGLHLGGAYSWMTMCGGQRCEDYVSSNYVNGYWLIWFFIPLVLNAVLRLNKQELAVIYAMIFSSWIISDLGRGVVGTIQDFSMRDLWLGNLLVKDYNKIATFLTANWDKAKWLHFDMSVYYFYDKEPANPIGLGRTGITALHTTAFTWTTLVSVTLIFWQIFLILLLRRQWVKEERLAFPMATPVTYLTEGGAKGSTEGGKPSIFKNKWLLIGLLVGTVMMIPRYWAYTFGAGKGSPYAANPYPPGGVALTYFWPGYFMGAVPFFLDVAIDPFMYGVGILVPMDIQLSAVIWYAFIGLVWPLIMVNVLMYAKPWVGWAGPRDFGFDTYVRGWGPATDNWLARFGWHPLVFAGYVWIVVWMVIRNRSSIAASLKSVIAPNPEVDRDEPMAYRWMFILMVVFLIALLGVLSMVGPIMWIVIFSLILQTFTWVGYARVRAESGYFGANASFYDTNNFAGAGYSMSQITGALYQGTGGVETYGTWASYATIPTARIMNYAGPVWSGYTNVGSGLPIWYALETFKVGDDVKASSKGIFIGVMLGLIASIAISYPLVFWRNVYFGGSYDGSYKSAWDVAGQGHYEWTFYPLGYFLSGAVAGAFSGYKFTYDFIGYVVIWVVIFAVLSLVRMRFAWLIFNPIGMIMATWGMGPIMFVPFIIMLVVRWVAVRTYGARVYEEKLLPLAVGLMLGFGLWWFIDRFVVMFWRILVIGYVPPAYR